MSEMFWILVGGMTGWLTGTFMGEQGYGKSLLGGYARCLDIVLGIVGASFGGYLFFWAVIGEGSSFSRYATAIFGSATLVGIVRLISARNLAWVRNNRFIQYCPNVDQEMSPGSEVNLLVSEFIDFNSGQISGPIKISFLNHLGTVFLRTLGQH